MSLSVQDIKNYSKIYTRLGYIAVKLSLYHI